MILMDAYLTHGLLKKVAIRSHVSIYYYTKLETFFDIYTHEVVLLQNKGLSTADNPSFIAIGEQRSIRTLL